MTDPVDALILDLLESLAKGTRPYAEVLDAWRTSCPRLPVWEEANARGYIRRIHLPGQVPQVALTELGREQVEPRLPVGPVKLRSNV